VEGKQNIRGDEGESAKEKEKTEK